MAVYKHILAPVDLSGASQAVGRCAGELTRRYDAQLTLLHVIDLWPSLPTERYSIPHLLEHDWEAEERLLVDRAREKISQLATELGLEEARQLIRIGSAKKEIIDVAEEEGVDLLVIGSHGHHGVTRLLGSTATAALHTAHCDVLAVRVE